MIVDSHCHLDRLDFDKLDLTLAQVLDNARAKDVEHFLCVSVTLAQFPDMLAKIEEFDDVSASCGIHPLDQKDALDKSELLALADHKKVVAIGETGLDYFRLKGDLTWQRERFRIHIRSAIKSGLPLIIHTRSAQEDTISIMKDEGANEAGGVMHCFTETVSYTHLTLPTIYSV